MRANWSELGLPVRHHLVVLGLGLLAFGCAGAGGGAVIPKSSAPISDWLDLYPSLADPEQDPLTERGVFRPRKLSREQRIAVNRALSVYTERDDEKFAPLRDELAEDPLASFWLAGRLVMFVMTAREASPPGGMTDPEVLVREPAWNRPFKHVVAMGPSAVPAIVIGLLRKPRGELVDLGGELLAAIGPDGLSRWQGVLRLEDARARRRATEVLASWSERSPEVDALLLQMVGDEDFGVRGSAYRGLSKNAEHAPLLTAALSTEQDSFVLREIVAGLGAHRSRQTATAVVEYMARCYAQSDERGMLAADAALRKMSGKKRRATLKAWRAWLTTLE